MTIITEIAIPIHARYDFDQQNAYCKFPKCFSDQYSSERLILTLSDDSWADIFTRRYQYCWRGRLIAPLSSTFTLYRTANNFQAPLSGNVASLAVFRSGCYLCLIFLNNEDLAFSNGVVLGQASSQSGNLSPGSWRRSNGLYSRRYAAMTNWRKRCTGRGRSDSRKCANKWSDYECELTRMHESIVVADHISSRGKRLDPVVQSILVPDISQLMIGETKTNSAKWSCINVLKKSPFVLLRLLTDETINCRSLFYVSRPIGPDKADRTELEQNSRLGLHIHSSWHFSIKIDVSPRIKIRG